MAKVLIVWWIILHCDKKSFKGMQWEDRSRGIFWLYWKHQSSRSCRENTAESASMYEYYRAWARHKNNNRRRQPRDLKAAFRNALEKKPELERLTDMDTKERIYWRIKNFPHVQNECAPTQSSIKKPRGRKPTNNLVQNGDKYPVNFGASTSKAGQDIVNLGASTSTTREDLALERKKSRKTDVKGKKVSAKSKKSFTNEEVDSMPCEGEGHEVANSQLPLPPITSFGKGMSFSETYYDKPKDEDLWTPQVQMDHLYGSHTDRYTPPQFPSDLPDVSPSDLMDFFVPTPGINYSFQPTPPQQTSDILFDNNADLLNLGNIIKGGEPAILKYSFPLQPKETPTSQSHQANMYTHQVPVTSLHCSVSDFTSPMRTSNSQNSNCVLDSRTTPVNAFLFDQKQCFYDQVVPQHCEAFQTSQQMVDTSEIFANDCLLYSPPSMNSHGQILEEMCYQQVDTGCHSTGEFRYNQQTSHDDSGISDMEDFLECANKLLDDIDLKRDGQYDLMY